MSKSKHKAKQQNFLQYFLNEFIFFRRDFSFVTHLSPEQAANNLRQLNFENQGCRRSRRIIAEVTDGFSEYSFEVKTEQPSKNRYAQSAKATGTIFADDDGVTIIEGTVTMGGLAYWIGVIFLLAIMMFAYIQVNSTSSSPVVFPIIVYGAILFYLWIQMYRDRNYLIQIIDYAINGDKAKHIGKSR